MVNGLRCETATDRVEIGLPKDADHRKAVAVIDRVPNKCRLDSKKPTKTATESSRKRKLPNA